MNGQQDVRDLVIEVVGAFLAAAIFALFKYVKLGLKKYLDKTIAACYQASSKFSFSPKKISLPALSKLDFAPLVRGVGELLLTPPMVLALTSMVFVNIIAITNSGRNAHAVSRPQSGTCYCPTKNADLADVKEPALQRGVLPRDCDQLYGPRPPYPTRSVLRTIERVPVNDCSPARKGRKSKRAVSPSTMGSRPAVPGIGA
jgi:hypothetical protein